MSSLGSPPSATFSSATKASCCSSPLSTPRISPNGGKKFELFRNSSFLDPALSGIALKKCVSRGRRGSVGVWLCAETESPLAVISPQETTLNTFSLLGRVLNDPEIKFLNSEVSQCRLLLEVSGEEDSTNVERIDLVIYQDLAERLSEVVLKGSEVFVTGRIRCESKLYLDVTDVKLVQRRKYFQQKQYNRDSDSSNEEMSTEKLWSLLMENYDQWYDNRNNKRSARSPDFVHKSRRKGWSLWINAKTPEWVDLDRLGNSNPQTAYEKDFNTRRKEQTHSTESRESDEDLLWEDLFQNPTSWWDNRFSKRNPKQPDFVYKNKELGYALWLSNRTPKWVLEKIDDL